MVHGGACFIAPVIFEASAPKYQLSVKILGEYQLSVNPIQTLKRSQLTSVQKNSMHYLPRGGSENNDFKNKLRQIQI